MGRLTLHGTNRKRFATCSWNEEFSLALSTDGASKGGSLEWTQFAPYSGGRATEISATDACALGPCQWFSLRGVSKTISPAPIRRMADSGNRPLGFHVRFGSKADICGAKWHVRFAPKSGHLQCTNSCPLCANSGHSVAEACRSDDNALPSAIKRKPLPTPPRRGGESNFRQIPHDAEAPNMPTGLRTRGGAGLQLFLEVGVRSGSDT